MFDNFNLDPSVITNNFDTDISVPLAEINAMPKSRVLSANARIKMIIPNFGLADGIYPGNDQEIDLGEIDSFTAKKAFKIVKKFKPFGFKYTKVLKEDDGWELSWSGGKTGWQANLFFYYNERMLQGYGESNEVGGQAIYDKVQFAIEQSVRHYDGSIERYIFRNVDILDFEQTISGDNGEITEKFSAFAKDRVSQHSLSNPQDEYKVIDKVAHIVDVMKRMNRS